MLCAWTQFPGVLQNLCATKRVALKLITFDYGNYCAKIIQS